MLHSRQAVALKLGLFTPDQFPLGASPVEPQPECPVHVHDSIEIAIVTGGAATHRLPRQSFPIEKGDVIVIPVGMEHGYGNCRSLHLMNVMFDARRLGLPEHQLLRLPGYRALFALEPRSRVRDRFASRLHLTDAQLESVLNLIFLVRSQIIAKTPGFELSSGDLLTALLVELSRYYAEMPNSASQSLVRIASLMEWVHEHFSDPITLDDLAHQAHMSRSTLSRAFRECLRKSPMSYVIELRMRQAEHLLCNTDTMVRDISERVGVEDPSYFARLFRKHTGLEPSAYRERHRATIPAI